MPLLRSLAVLKDQSSNKNLKLILDDIHHRVEDGTALGDAMARYPRAFNEMAVNMVRAGAEGGFLEDALERVAGFTETQEDLKGRTVSAMAYPCNGPWLTTRRISSTSVPGGSPGVGIDRLCL